MSSSKGGVYKVSVGATHFYFGRTSNVRRRARVHLADLRRGKHCNPYLQNVYNLVQDFQFEVLLASDDEMAMQEVEQGLLDMWCGQPGCVNLNRSATRGPGMTGKQHSAATKQLIRSKRSEQVFSEETKQMFRDRMMGNTINRGRVQSEDSRNKKSIAMLGVGKSAQHKMKISESKQGISPHAITDEYRKNQSEAQKRRWAAYRASRVAQG
jgi:hypothetical protein